LEVTARDIQEQQFHDAWRGYNQEEVDDFLDDVAETIDRLARENESLRTRLRQLEETAHSAKSTEEMLKKTLLSAQQAAEESIAEAHAKADAMIAEAEARARSTDHDTQGRVTAAEEEVRRQTAEVHERFEARKAELDDSLGRLEAFEDAIKTRLRSFLEQGLGALEDLKNHQQRPEVRSPEPLPEEPPRAEAEEPQPADPEPQEAQGSQGSESSEQSAEAPIGSEAVAVEEPAQEAIYELDSDVATVFDSLPQREEDAASLEDFKPFDDDAAAVEGRRKRRLFKRRVDDWA
jgi:cell division initiation protein